MRLFDWLQKVDLNHRPSGYEPDELPGCSIPRYIKTALRLILLPSLECLFSIAPGCHSVNTFLKSFKKIWLCFSAAGSPSCVCPAGQALCFSTRPVFAIIRSIAGRLCPRMDFFRKRGFPHGSLHFVSIKNRLERFSAAAPEVRALLPGGQDPHHRGHSAGNHRHAAGRRDPRGIVRV